MGNEEVINKIKAYIILLKDHFDIDKVFLYGSYSKGKPHKDSDIDVAIVVNKLEGDFFDTIPVAWKLRSKIDNRIEPLIFEKGKDRSGFLKEIIKTGIEIT